MRARVAITAVGAVAVLTGCGAAASDPNVFGGGGGTGSATNGGGSGAPVLDIPSGGGPDRGNCGGDRYDAQPTQLDIYVMLDDSGSMVPWWIGVADVFGQFLDDPSSAGIGVGIQYFGSECDAAYYATPRVPIAPLPQNVQPIRNSFPLIPIEGTATEPALRGAIQHARAWSTMHPDHKVVVLLVTDGLPDDCASTVANVSQVAQEGVTGTPSIPTYVLGLGLTLMNLDQIAQAGGTSQAVIVDPASPQALAQAMNQIRGAALPCDYQLPNGGSVDPTKVNIEFSPDGASSSTVPNVGDASRCDPSQGGWYYDNPTAPSRAIVCPATCTTFKGTASGQVDVVLGCDIVLR
jgi:hypothetical protein